MKLVLTLVAFAFASVPVHVRADLPEYLTESFANTRWIAYSPTGLSPMPESAAEIERDLLVLRQYGFGGIVTYGCDGLKKQIPELARKVGIEHILVGIWDPKDDHEFSNAKSLAHLVDGYVVGNEGIGKENRYSFDELNTRIQQLKRWSGKPVTTSEQIEDYWQIPALVTLGDWLFPIVHPYWNGKTAEPDASRWTKAQIDRLREIATNRPIICREVGLPTDSLDELVTPPSEQTQAEYYVALRALDVPFIYFEAFDQPWKKNAPVEPYWGLFAKDRKPKRIVELLVSPPHGVQFTSVRDGGVVPVRMEPDGGFFEVMGTSSGVIEDRRTLLFLVATGDPAASGWFLQLDGVKDLRDDGSWTATAQIGNRQYPPRGDQKIRLRIMAVPQETAKKLTDERRGNIDLRNKGIYSQDLPQVERQWISEVKDVKLEIK